MADEVVEEKEDDDVVVLWSKRLVDESKGYI